jgi:hypothetical protein
VFVTFLVVAFVLATYFGGSIFFIAQGIIKTSHSDKASSFLIEFCAKILSSSIEYFLAKLETVSHFLT